MKKAKSTPKQLPAKSDFLDGDWTLTRYESEAEFRARIEAVPVWGQPGPFVRSLLRDHAKGRADCVGLLMQVFSPGRFVPAYWERFDPPDLAKEFEDLDLRTRVVPLGKILTEEELGRFKDKVNAALAAWIDWRRRAIDAGILTALRKIGGRKAIDAAFQQWVDENRGLKQEWDDLGDTIDELHRDLTRMAAMIDTRAAEQPDSPAEHAAVADIVPLTIRARIIREKLESLKPTEAMKLPELQDWYETRAELPQDAPKILDEGTWKRVRKELLPCGLRNSRGRGYFIQK